ncbi:MAG: transposase [Actinobacteria bacterium]|nr:transposase [Actinomycetota bacterium]
MSVRRLIAEADLDDLNVAQFCRDHGISRWTFYDIRKRATEDPADDLEPRSRAPHHVANRTRIEVEDLIITIRKDLADCGLDAGPATIAVHLAEVLEAVPSESTIWQVLKRRGFIVADPTKAPKRAHRRFVAERANECWQIDDTMWWLADGAEVKIIDVIDDCSRLALATEAALSCTTEAAFGAMAKGAGEFGWPERFLSDNARTFRGGRHDKEGGLAATVAALGVGHGHSRPYHPQTCGKVERFHQTVKKFLGAQDPASSIEELQAQLDWFRHYYNDKRPHRSIGRRPPRAVWDETPKSGPAAVALGTPSKVFDALVTNGAVSVGPYRIALGAVHTGSHATVVITGTACHVFIAGRPVRDLQLQPDRRYQPMYGRPGPPSRC